MEAKPFRISVVVLGDVGRSPRMQYHAYSLSQIGSVRLIGLEGETCISEVNDHCELRPISDCTLFSNFPWVIRAPLRSAILSLKLLFALLEDLDCDLFLVQNPPAIPTLIIVYMAAFLLGASFVIDWHNLGFKMLPPRLHRVVRAYEHYLALWCSDLNLCVTIALKNYLESEFQLTNVVVLHDRPFKRFLVSDSKADCFQQLKPRLPIEIEIENARLVVSCTSWTDDEDFDMLFTALKKCTHPKLIVVITGKGPLRSRYQPLLENLSVETQGRIHVFCLWFSNEDYPKFLRMCDIGVCMHTSTSGLDLPMKVLDMFGSGLPVLAKRFACVEELVHPNQNGYLFDNADMLAALLDQDNYDGVTLGVRESILDWEENWNANVLSPLKDLLQSRLSHHHHPTWFARFVGFWIHYGG